MADVILTIDDENYAISGDGVVYSISDKCALSNVFFFLLQNYATVIV